MFHADFSNLVGCDIWSWDFWRSCLQLGNGLKIWSCLTCWQRSREGGMEEPSGEIVKDSSRQAWEKKGCKKEGRKEGRGHIDSQFIMLRMTERVREQKGQAGNGWVVIPESNRFTVRRWNFDCRFVGKILLLQSPNKRRWRGEQREGGKGQKYRRWRDTEKNHITFYEMTFAG